MSEGKPEERPSDSVLSGEQSFKMLADTLPELVFIVDKEFEGTFLNRRYAEFSALTTESGLGRGWQGILHPEDLEEALKKWRVSLETRSAYQCEQRLKNFDGEYIWHLVKALPVYDEQNEIVSFFGTCTDIHYKKQSREELERLVSLRTRELHDSKKLTEQILESISDAIVIADVQGNLTYVNKAARDLYGDNKVSANLFDAAERARLLSAEDGIALCVHQLPLSRALRGETVSDAEMVLGEKGLEQKVFSAAARPFKNAEGEITGAVAALRDITLRKRQEQALKNARDEAHHANKLKSEFVANISHEIRTPMSGILGLSEILASETEGTSQEIAGHVLSSAQNLMHLVNDLLDLSKLEAGKLEIKNELFSIEQVADDVLTAFYVTASNKKIKLISAVDPTLKDNFLGDANRIRQVLQNLVQNALKFTDEGSVSITAKPLQRNENVNLVRFAVRDTGPGISEMNQGKLFQLFVQVDGSSTRRHGGTGLGLALSKRMVELMNGEIGVDSEEGKGSEFWFSLPLQNISAQ